MTVCTQPIPTKLANGTSCWLNKKTNRNLLLQSEVSFSRQPPGQKMDKLKLLLPLSMVFLSGCTAYQVNIEADQTTGITRIDSSVEYVGPDNIHLSEEQYPKDVVLMFPYVTGSIFGTTSPAPIYIVQVDRQLNFSLDLTEKIDEIHKAAAPLTEQWRSIGLTIEPEKTRIIRIGTFPYSYATEDSIGVGGFIDPVSRNTMILVYVDRACEIKGEVDSGREHYSHHLLFSGKGFHWIEVIKHSKNYYILQNYHGDNTIKFSVHIENLQLI
jgi:hypothetical protein